MRVALLALAACWSHSDPPPPQPAAPPPAPAEVRCKIAIERAAEKVDIRPKDVTMAIGECEQQNWTADSRACIAAVKNEDDLVACGRKHALTEPALFRARMSMREAFAMMEKFRDQMCACADSTCAQGVADAMSKWSQEMAKEQQEPVRASEEETKRMAGITTKMVECMTRAMNAGSPPTP